MSECTCTPGTEADGWQEQRCEVCLAEERAEWARACAMIPDLLVRFRLGREP
jgi:hypothetical protein